MFQFEEEFSNQAQIRVVGVGGAGGNAVNGMVASGLNGVEFIAVNTDAQALQESQASIRIQIGTKVTRGLGSGGDPRVGMKAIEEDQALAAEALAGADMIFVTAGMGGGTGTGAAPAIARIGRELGSLVVGIVTLPFGFEGKRRGSQGMEGLEQLKSEVDTLIVIPNDRLLKVVSPNTPLSDAFRVADNVLYQATKGISDLITVPGLVNLDFADVRAIMADMGDAIMGTGVAKGENRAGEAASAAISSPLLEDVDIMGAQGVLVNITGDHSLTLHEVSEVTGIIQDAVGSDANLIFGAVVDDHAAEELRVTVIATGFGSESRQRQAEASGKIRSISDSRLDTILAEVETTVPAEASEPVPAVAAEEEPVFQPLEDDREMEIQEQSTGMDPAPAPERPREIPIRPLRSVEPARPQSPAASESEPAAPTDFRLLNEGARMEARSGESAEAGQDADGSRFPTREELERPAFLRRLRD